MSNFNSADIAAFKDVWVFCEQREGKLMPTDFELISKGRDLADELGVNLCGLLLGGLLAVQLAFYAAPWYLLPQLRRFSGDILTAIFPNLALNEFGYEFVALGVAMYFLKTRPDKMAAVYLLFGILLFSRELLGDMEASHQFIMVLALPFMLLYNRQKGRGWKWFFYIFYPLHVFILFYLANFVL